MRRLAAVVFVFAVTTLVTHAQPKPPIAELKTTAEASGFTSTSSYEDVVKFMKAVDEASPLIFYSSYGKTFEGRDMPLAVVGAGLKDGSPAAVKASGKLRVHIQGNIHAGEVEGKESAQILLREFAMGQHKDWLQSMVFLITPIFNADGNEKMAVNNRGRQNGPINGMGTRPNAQGLNINRDFMKLDTPEGKAFVKLWNDYDPQVGFDLHTSDGSYHGYYLTYSPPLNPDTSATIVKLMVDEWFPYVTKDMKAKHGWDSFYYGNAATPGGRGAGGGAGAPGAGRGRGQAAPGGAPGGAPGATPPPQRAACENIPVREGVTREWGTFEHTARFHNNYVGMRNRFALLSEAYAYATFEDRIKATNYFMEGALDFAHKNVARLKKIIADADKEKIVGTTLATTAKFKRGGNVPILMGEVEAVKNPNNNADMCNRKDVVKAEQMVDMMWFEANATEIVPAAYYVPLTATKAIEVLKAHGIQMKEMMLAGNVDGFGITANSAGQNFEGHVMRRLEGTWSVKPDMKPGVKFWEVRMDQPLARLAFDLIEPTSDDGLVAWNFLEDELKTDARVYPILRRK